MREDSLDPRIRSAKDKQRVIKFLMEEGPFGTLASVLAFAAALGYKERVREPLGSEDMEARWNVFENEGTAFIADLIAACEIDEVAILRDDRAGERRKLFAEYANGGLQRLQTLVLDKPRPPEDVLLELILSLEEEGEETKTEGWGSVASKLATPPPATSTD